MLNFNNYYKSKKIIDFIEVAVISLKPNYYIHTPT